MESTLTRLIYREFLLEPDLYREAGLEQLPAKIAQAIEVSPSEALSRLTASPLLEPLDLETLQHLVAVRDMAIISRTAAVHARRKSVSMFTLRTPDLMPFWISSTGTP